MIAVGEQTVSSGWPVGIDFIIQCLYALRRCVKFKLQHTWCLNPRCIVNAPSIVGDHVGNHSFAAAPFNPRCNQHVIGLGLLHNHSSVRSVITNRGLETPRRQCWVTVGVHQANSVDTSDVISHFLIENVKVFLTKANGKRVTL